MELSPHLPIPTVNSSWHQLLLSCDKGFYSSSTGALQHTPQLVSLGNEFKFTDASSYKIFSPEIFNLNLTKLADLAPI